MHANERVWDDAGQGDQNYHVVGLGRLFTVLMLAHRSVSRSSLRLVSFLDPDEARRSCL